MKSSKQNILFFAVIVASLAFFTSLGVAGEAKVGLSDQDEDAFILYKYSLIDAKKKRHSKITKALKTTRRPSNTPDMHCRAAP